MANELNVDEIMDRAKRAQESRLAAIQRVVEARQALIDERAATDKELAELQATIAQRLTTAQQNDLRAYTASLAAGWTPEELKKIGFAEPEKRARARRRTTRSAATRSTPVKDDGASQGTSPATGGDTTGETRPTAEAANPLTTCGQHEQYSSGLVQPTGWTAGPSPITRTQAAPSPLS